MITIYTRKDVREERKITNITDLEYTDFTQSKDPYIKADLVMFVDTEEFVILKNRLEYPKQGTLFPIEHLESLLVEMMGKLQF